MNGLAKSAAGNRHKVRTSFFIPIFYQIPVRRSTAKHARKNFIHLSHLRKHLRRNACRLSTIRPTATRHSNSILHLFSPPQGAANTQSLSRIIPKPNVSRRASYCSRRRRNHGCLCTAHRRRDVSRCRGFHYFQHLTKLTPSPFLEQFVL